MKKVLAIVLSALLLVAALAGCASKSETASNDTPASTDPPLRTLKFSSRLRTRWLPRAMTSRS